MVESIAHCLHPSLKYYLHVVIFLIVSNGVLWGFSILSSFKELSLNSFQHFCSNGKSATQITKFNNTLH